LMPPGPRARENFWSKAMGYKVAVAGATGNVGREVLSIMAERQFPADEVIALASSRSIGAEISYGDVATLKVRELAAVGRDAGAGAYDPWPGECPLVDGASERLVAEPARVAEVADGRDAGVEERLGAGGAAERTQREAFGEDRLHPALHQRRVRFLEVQQVRVRVDQAGEDGVPAEVEDRGAVWCVQPRPDRLDAVAADQEVLALDHPPGLGVEDPTGADERGGAARRRALGEREGGEEEAEKGGLSEAGHGRRETEVISSAGRNATS